MKITKHLSTHEVSCKCGCGFNKLDPMTAKAFEKIREIAGNQPLTISSGCRCEAHNKAIGGATSSQHVKGTALDIRVPKGMDFDFFYGICDNVIGHVGGVGKYSDLRFVHIDTRGHRARWGK